MDFQHLHLPRDVRNWNFKSEGDRVKWNNCPDQIEPWKVSFRITYFDKQL